MDVSRKLGEKAWNDWKESALRERVMKRFKPKSGDLMIYLNRPSDEELIELKNHGFKPHKDKIASASASIKVKKKEDLSYFKLLFDDKFEYAVEHF